MWHVSASIQRPGVGYIIDPAICEAESIALLRGVGGDHEWWLPAGESNPAVTHLRIPTTTWEQTYIPPGLVTMDAGTTGPRRQRRR